MLSITPAITFASPNDRDLGIVRLRYATIVVRDYDEALNWYTNVLGFEKVEDAKFGNRDNQFGKDFRWIVVAPQGRKDVGIILEIAKSYSSTDSIGNYNARVGTETRWVFEVEDCHKFYAAASARGIKFIERPIDEPWGVTEAMFEDLYGNVFVVENFRAIPGTSTP